MKGRDIIQEFSDILGTHSDIPEAFRIAGGYFINASTIGRFYELYDMDFFKPNLYIVLASPPRITRRGELLKSINKVTTSAYYEYHKILDDNKAIDEIKSHMFDGGSTAGLIDDINLYSSRGINSFAVKSSEFGKRLKDIVHSSGYMVNMDGLLLKLYSGEADYSSYSHKKGGTPRYLPPKKYFNLFGTMQNLEHYIEETKIAYVGLARRLSIFSLRGDDLNDYRPPLGRDTSQQYTKLNELGLYIGRMLHVNHQKYFKKNSENPIIIKYTEEVKTKLNELDKKVTDLLRSDDTNPYYNFLQGKFDQITKFAMNRCISRNRNVISIDDFEIAQKHAQFGTRDIEETFMKTLIPKEKKHREQAIDAIIRCFKKGWDKRRTQSSLCSYGVRAKEFNELISLLIMEGKIKANKEGGFDVL